MTNGWWRAYGVLAMIAATVAYNVGIILLALAAREESKGQDRKSLITHVAERSQGWWSIGLSMVGWFLELFALTQISVTLARVIYAAGFGVMLVLARWRLGETLQRLEAIGIVAIGIGIAGVGIEAPGVSKVGLNWIGWAILTAVVIPVIFIPDISHRLFGYSAAYMSAVGAGLGYASTSLYSKGVTDYLSLSTWLPLIVLATGAAVTSIIAFANQISALQSGRATEMVPIIGGLQSIVPIIVASFAFGERWPRELWAELLLGGGIFLAVVGMGLLAFSSAQFVHGAHQAESAERQNAMSTPEGAEAHAG